MRLEDAKEGGRSPSHAFGSASMLTSTRIASRQRSVSKKEVVKLCSTLASAMRSCFVSVAKWDEGKVAKVVAKTCQVTAEDPVFNEILKSSEGTRSVQQVGFSL